MARRLALLIRSADRRRMQQKEGRSMEQVPLCSLKAHDPSQKISARGGRSLVRRAGATSSSKSCPAVRSSEKDELKHAIQDRRPTSSSQEKTKEKSKSSTVGEKIVVNDLRRKGGAIAKEAAACVNNTTLGLSQKSEKRRRMGVSRITEVASDKCRKEMSSM